MSVISQIAKDEWRFWKRTKTATTILIIGIVLTVISAVVNSVQMEKASHEREHFQSASEAQFLDQPTAIPTEWCTMATTFFAHHRRSVLLSPVLMPTQVPPFSSKGTGKTAQFSPIKDKHQG